METLNSFEQRGLEMGLERGLEMGLERGRNEGLEMGLRDGIALALDLKFGAAGTVLLPELEQISDARVLQAVLGAIKGAPDVAAVRAVYASSLPPDGAAPAAMAQPVCTAGCSPFVRFVSFASFVVCGGQGAAVTQVQALNSEQLLSLAESLLDFTTTADLTAWLVANPPDGAAPAAIA